LVASRQNPGMAKLEKLRSQRWPEGKPVVAIFNNWNDCNRCHQPAGEPQLHPASAPAARQNASA
jgi:hypothetical protein